MGRAVVTKNNVLIETAEGVERYPRSELLSIIRGELRERNFWSTRLSVGFSGSAGNTNQGQMNAHWDLRRADQRTRTELSYDGTFGYANEEQTVNRHRGVAETKLFISKRFFFVPATSEFLNDKFTNFKFRATPGTGAGVHVFNTKKVEWDLGGALGYQFTRFLSTAAGVKNPQNDGFVSFRTYADFDFTDDVELEIEWRSNVKRRSSSTARKTPLRGPMARCLRRTTTSSSSAWRSSSGDHKELLERASRGVGLYSLEGPRTSPFPRPISVLSDGYH
ncbi:MAG: DUF481 domain-containing protein [Deltaproteobacteria bacterium]|nr:DUF481 domain-containing protein [Deltaproteobacteria bacterium]